MHACDPSHPETFPRRTLLCVAGLFPQVITETLYALAVASAPPFVPTDVLVISTEEGIKRAKLMLLSPDQDQFGRLCADYGLTGIAFGVGSLTVLQGPFGPLADIRDEHDNACAADQITQLIATLTRDPERALHVSIAGGRKTLGFYAGYALSLLGRGQDRLSHVLVNEPFEGNAAFFYPPPSSRVLILDKTRPVETSEARIDLAYIPFVRLRHGLPASLVDRDMRFSEVVRIADHQFGPPQVRIDLLAGTVRCGGLDVAMRPMSLAVYAALAQRVVEGSGALPTRDISSPHFANHVIEHYRRIARLDQWAPRLTQLRGHLLDSADAADWFREHVSRANRAISAAARGQPTYLVQKGGPKNQRRYGLALAPEAIRFHEADDLT